MRVLKKILLGCLGVLFLSYPSHAVTIVNKNVYNVTYAVNHPMLGCTPLNWSFSKGELGVDGWYQFRKSSFFSPERVCVYIRGKSSTTGEGGFRQVRNVDSCMITVTDAGFLRGIRLNYSPECG